MVETYTLNLHCKKLHNISLLLDAFLSRLCQSFQLKELYCICVFFNASDIKFSLQHTNGRKVKGALSTQENRLSITFLYWLLTRNTQTSFYMILNLNCTDLHTDIKHVKNQRLNKINEQGLFVKSYITKRQNRIE